MRTKTIHGIVFKQYSPEETALGQFVPAVRGKEGWVTDEGKGFGLYKIDDKWCLYRDGFHPDYMWGTLEEAVSTCAVLHKMDAMPPAREAP